jgi:hypothetical protein
MLGHTFLGRHVRSAVQALGQSLVVSSTNFPSGIASHEGATLRLGWDIDDAQFLPAAR